ncbi:ATP-binding protein [Nocardioides pocheonensis]|uniref:ATP-binding protein n=2 Tax=Nocardioides pocheonensis TaxID=661485 RepID=A0A3N0GNZ9_9ACTN|nr:ATP-binding protein [Nocardioides pocheonensis]
MARLAALPHVRRVGLALLEGGGRRLRFTASDRDPAADVAWCHVDAYDDVPLNTAVRTGLPVVGSVVELAARYPEFAARQSEEHQAVAAVPIATGRDVVGGYVLYFDSTQVLDDEPAAGLVQQGRDLAASLREARRPHERPPAFAGPVPPEGALVAVHEVAGDRSSVAPARRFLEETLSGWGVDDDVVEASVVCLSELVTNAVIHAQGGCIVRAELHDDVLTVSVRDSGSAGAAHVTSIADPLQVHGRGLQLVEALTSRWAYEIDGDGAVVWFAQDLASPPTSAVSGTPTPR